MNSFTTQVAELRPMLVRMAHQRLRNGAWAEDAVSETVVAALEKPAEFAHRSALQTWLVGILKHKTVDQIRRHTREYQITTIQDEPESQDYAQTQLDVDIDEVIRKNDPQESLSQRQVMARLERCLKALPAQHAQAFMLRHWMEKETTEICRDLGITTSNLNVILHRTKTRLRTSLTA